MLSFKGLQVLLSIPIKLLLVLLKYPFTGGINPKFKNDLINSLKLVVFRTALFMPVRESAILSIMSNRFLINTFIRTLYPSLTKLPNYGKRYDKQSHWIVKPHARNPSDPILIFLHGGGYYFDTMPSQIESLLTIYHLLDQSKQEKLSILALDYKLASKGYTMPYQLTELTDTYTNLVNEGNDNFILMGDSAGGNLSLIFLQQLRLSKNPFLPYPKSIVLISPWVKIAPTIYPKSSYLVNDPHDMIQIDHFRDPAMQHLILGDEDYESLTISPGNCEYNHSDWEEITSLNHEESSVFVIVGEHECFRDDVLEWCRYALRSPLVPQHVDSKGIFNPKIHEYIRNEKGKAYVDVVVEPWGVHDSILYFENSLVSKVKHNPDLTISSVDPEKYFGICKLVKFLNKTLPDGKK
ncbi:hypothetical protein SBY92_002668 [Candida maltosa Xu316]|uniref:Alpha/beta hydrolase fold-3 domain-containing protein n=1 Tax=Candida maltosa (strain Xu316) TaxID=1245528 RepID=M3JVV2_CANMX|nr:hypothetical protein G210_3235 [Candida maltosa Xu316]